MPRIDQPTQRQLATPGWHPETIVDTKQPKPGEPRSGKCDRCGKQNLRYVHIVKHPDIDATARLGCCCAARMCLDYDAATEEREFKNRAARKLRFADLSKWRESRNNPANIVRTVRTGHGTAKVTVYQKSGQCFAFSLSSGPRKRPDTYFDQRAYSSRSEAIQAAFNFMEAHSLPALRKRESDSHTDTNNEELD